MTHWSWPPECPGDSWENKIRAAGLPSLRPLCHIWGVLPQEGDKGWAVLLPHREWFIPISTRWCCSWIQRGSGTSQIFTWPHGSREALERVLVHFKDICPHSTLSTNIGKCGFCPRTESHVIAEPFPFLTHLLTQDLNEQWRWNQACLHVRSSQHLPWSSDSFFLALYTGTDVSRDAAHFPTDEWKKTKCSRLKSTTTKHSRERT